MTEARVPCTKAKTPPPPWQASLAFGACLGLIASWFGPSHILLELLKVIYFKLNISGTLQVSYLNEFLAIAYILYFIFIYKLGVGLFRQYFICGLLLSMPSFIFMRGLSIFVDPIALPALAGYGIAVSRGRNPITAALLGGVLGLAFVAAVLILITATWTND